MVHLRFSSSSCGDSSVISLSSMSPLIFPMYLFFGLPLLCLPSNLFDLARTLCSILIKFSRDLASTLRLVWHWHCIWKKSVDWMDMKFWNMNRFKCRPLIVSYQFLKAIGVISVSGVRKDLWVIQQLKSYTYTCKQYNI